MGLFDFLKSDKAEKTTNVQLHNPVDGRVMPISEVADPVFSEKMMGDGFGVAPKKGEIYSPVNGKVATVFPTKHAIGVKLANDIDVLIHIGIDTVELEGKPFEVLVEEGQEVSTDTLLVKVDLDALEEAGKEDTVIIAFTNMDIVEDYSLSNTGELNQGDLIGEISSKE
ncbi:MAG: PTS glucose transporter subunit IIA [Atopostipes suicloacalis]|nr:PTS glucose transporter subunit IIA [Atopostipes suicloacalis]